VRRIIAIATPILGLFVLTWAQTFFSAAAVVAVPACSTFDANPIGEITGIEVLADTLTAGHGCGPGPGQIYKYISIVTVPLEAGVLNTTATPGAYLAGASTDCFANATFINLCTYEQNTQLNEEYDVTVYAFTADQWNLVSPATNDAGSSDDAGTATDAGATDASATDGGAIDASPVDAALDDGAVSDASIVDASDASDASTVDASLPDASGVDASSDAGAPDAVAPEPGSTLSTALDTDNAAAASANTAANSNNTVCGTPDAGLPLLSETLLASAGWVTHCQAIQQSNIPVLAQCGPLVQLR